MSKKAIHWSGVFPAVSTQFRQDYSLDLDATHAVMKNLVRDGVSGLVVCGSVGENTSLTTEEKLQIIEVAKDAAGGKIPVIAGVAEFTTAFAQKMAKEAERVGVDGIMVMPALVYSSKPHETAAHFRSVATATDLPIMVYNNPPIYKNDVTPDILATLTDCDNIVCFKDSSGDTRRFVDLRNTVGDRFVLFAGLDDVVVESIAVGAEGWISGMSNAFPREGETLFRLAAQKRYDEAMALYRWFMPLLHLDARPDLVQCIKLCEELLGRGSAVTRPPRLALEGETRQQVVNIVEQALATRPVLPDDERNRNDGGSAVYRRAPRRQRRSHAPQPEGCGRRGHRPPFLSGLPGGGRTGGAGGGAGFCRLFRNLARDARALSGDHCR
jgi:4-hydroxy-tetrahydrodipicolinate synthase